MRGAARDCSIEENVEYLVDLICYVRKAQHDNFRRHMSRDLTRVVERGAARDCSIVENRDTSLNYSVASGKLIMTVSDVTCLVVITTC